MGKSSGVIVDSIKNILQSENYFIFLRILIMAANLKSMQSS